MRKNAQMYKKRKEKEMHIPKNNCKLSHIYSGFHTDLFTLPDTAMPVRTHQYHHYALLPGICTHTPLQSGGSDRRRRPKLTSSVCVDLF